MTSRLTRWGGGGGAVSFDDELVCLLCVETGCVSVRLNDEIVWLWRWCDHQMFVFGDGVIIRCLFLVMV